MQGVKVKILAPEKHLFMYGNKIVLHYFHPLPRGDSARNRLYARAPKRELEELLRRALSFLLLYFFQATVCPGRPEVARDTTCSSVLGQCFS